MPAEPINYSKDLVNGVAEFDIQLARDTLILTSDPTELEINPDASRLSGKVILTLTEPLRDVKSVEFRFVGGVVSKLEYDPDDRFACNLRGTSRLFDKQIKLYDGNEKGNVMDAKKHELDFNLKLPTYFPPSMNHRNTQVQYLLVAAVDFEPKLECCGYNIGAFLDGWINAKPMITKQEVLVRRIPYPDDAFYGRLSEAEKALQTQSAGQDKESSPLLAISDFEAEESESGELRHSNNASVLWTPNEHLLVRLPTKIEVDDEQLFLRLHLNSDYTIDSLKWAYVQDSALSFKFTIAKRNHALDEIDLRKKKHRSVLSKGEITQLSLKLNSNNEQEGIVVLDLTQKPNVDASGNEYPSQKLMIDVSEDVESDVATIRHELELEICVTKKSDGSKQTWKVFSPVQFYKSHKAGVVPIITEETITNAIVAPAAELDADGIRKRF